jgi:hypothetical protein
MVYSFILTVLVLTWVPAYLFYPLFFYVNSLDYYVVYLQLLLIQLIGATVYIGYFTIEFSLVLYSFYNSFSVSSAILKKHKVLAIKSILHCFTSIIANVLYEYVPIFGPLLYNLFIIGGIHFLFNSKLDKCFGISKQNSSKNLLSNNNSRNLSLLSNSRIKPSNSRTPFSPATSFKVAFLTHNDSSFFTHDNSRIKPSNNRTPFSPTTSFDNRTPFLPTTSFDNRIPLSPTTSFKVAT